MAKSKKEKRQKYIRKILKDNKVSKKEVRKAAKKGISLDRISKAVRKSTQPGNVFSRPQSSPSRVTPADIYKSGGGQPSQAKAPTPAAPVIRPGAQTLIDRDIASRAAAKVAGISNATPIAPPQSDPGLAPGGDSRDNETVEVNPLQDALDSAIGRIGDLETQLAETPDFATIFAQQAERDAAQRQADLEAARQQQALFMEEMAARNAEQERMRFLTSQTQQANMARAGLTPDFSIGGRARADLYGTGGFKRRRRIRPATIAQGIAPTTPTAGATNGNLLNV